MNRLPARLRGQLFRLLRDPWWGRWRAVRYGDLDKASTRAVSDEMNYAATLSLEVPEGERESALRELIPLLESWTVDGHRVVETVHRGQDLFEGPAARLGPDLVLTLALRDNYTYTLLPSARAAKGQTWREFAPAEYVGGRDSE